MKKAYTEHTDRELLKVFAEKFEEYDSLKDEELEILGDHPNRDFWDDELSEEYNELTDRIVTLGLELKDLSQFIGNLK